MEQALEEWKSAREQASAEMGYRKSFEAKRRLLLRSRVKERNLDDNIDFLIKSEKDALHAMNLHRLLTKNWIEHDNAYRVCSQIKESQESRLQNILQDNRYS